jgi:hypothetical protein
MHTGLFYCYTLWLQGPIFLYFFSYHRASDVTLLLCGECMKVHSPPLTTKLLKSVFVYVVVFVFCLKYRWNNVWLKKKRKFLFMGPTKLCVWNTWKSKAGLTCFSRLHHAASLQQCEWILSHPHCSLKQFFFFEKLVRIIDFTRIVHVNVIVIFIFK